MGRCEERGVFLGGGVDEGGIGRYIGRAMLFDLIDVGAVAGDDCPGLELLESRALLRRISQAFRYLR
jgi:hypothetical protein